MVLINCTTKGCLKQSEAKLDRDTNEVICDECGNSVVGISLIMKRSLNSIGQVVRHKKAKPFQQRCTACNTNRSLCVKEDRAYCEVCNTQIHITPAFLQGLKIHLRSKEKDKEVGIE